MIVVKGNVQLKCVYEWHTWDYATNYVAVEIKSTLKLSTTQQHKVRIRAKT